MSPVGRRVASWAILATAVLVAVLLLAGQHQPKPATLEQQLGPLAVQAVALYASQQGWDIAPPTVIAIRFPQPGTAVVAVSYTYFEGSPSTMLVHLRLSPWIIVGMN